MDEATPPSTSGGAPNGCAVIVTGGAPLEIGVLSIVDEARLVVAADSGLDHLLAWGRLPHLVVGDLDSVSPAALLEAQRRGVPVDRHPTDKDATDTELALVAALDRGFGDLTLLTGGGDRLDHVMGWLAVLADRRLAAAHRVAAWCGTTHLQVLHGPRRHRWREPDLDAVVSLLPLAGDCHGVTTTGLRWPLDDATLSATSSRGVSNAVADTELTVGLTSGVLAVVRPHRRATPPSTLDPLDPLRPGRRS